MASMIGQRLGQYTITELLGKGGMASVYRARQDRIERDVAIKLIKADLAEREDFIKRFQREAKLIASLSHPHILKLFDYGQHEDTVYLVTELLTGGSLYNLLMQGALYPDTALTMLTQIASALDYAHKRGIVHRDLKPQNILLDSDGNSVLSDFGLAKLVEESSTLTKSGALMGTPAYMAPEQWRGDTVDWRTDIYALGVILFQMLAGQLPFDSETPYTLMHMHIYQAPPSLKEINASFSLGIDRIIEKALAKDRDVRFDSGMALVNAFKAAIQQVGSDATPVPPKIKPIRPDEARPAATPNTPFGSYTDAQAAFAGNTEIQPQQPKRAKTPGPWAGPRLYAIFEYLAQLVAEREADEPFLFSQIEPTILYMTPDFTYEAYKLSGIKDFIIAGEKAGYFRAMQDSRGMYLVPGSKVAPVAEGSDATADDARSWMTRTLDKLLRADRADELAEAIQGVDALTLDFDAFLDAESRNIPLYLVRGKILRIREFLKNCRQRGLPQAQAAWQISRSTIRMPAIPEMVSRAGVAQTLLWALFQGNTRLAQVPPESLDPLFFAVLAFNREQMARKKIWDWVVGLDLLDMDAREVRRAADASKRGLFGGKTGSLNENEIKAITARLREAAGIQAEPIDHESLWGAFVETANMEASLRFLAEQPALLQNDALVNWLDAQISSAVAYGQTDAIKNLATKSAIVITARKYGLDQVRQQGPELKRVYESVLEGAHVLKMLFDFVDASTPSRAANYFARHPEFAGSELVEHLLDQQVMNAVEARDVDRYQRLTDRSDLWRNLLEFGPQEGLRQHMLFLAAPRAEKTIQAEMGITLLAQAKDSDEYYDIIGRFPSVASNEALAMVNQMLSTLSRQGATADYNRYTGVKRLIERCLQVGVDRALAQFK